MEKQLKPFRGAGGGGSSEPDFKPDTLFSIDHVSCLLGISEGPIKGLRNGTEDFYIGTTPLKNPGATQRNFKNIDLRIYKGTDPGDRIKMRLGGFTSSQTVQTSLAQDVPVVRQGLTKNIDWIDMRMVMERLYEENEGGLKEMHVDFKVEVKPVSETTWQTPTLALLKVNEGGSSGTDYETIFDSDTVWAYKSLQGVTLDLDGMDIEVTVNSTMPAIPDELSDPTSPEAPTYYTPGDPNIYNMATIQDSFYWFDLDNNHVPYWIDVGVGYGGEDMFVWLPIPGAVNTLVGTIPVWEWDWQDRDAAIGAGTPGDEKRRLYYNMSASDFNLIFPNKGDLAVTATNLEVYIYNGSSWIKPITMAEGSFDHDLISLNTTGKKTDTVRIWGKTTSPVAFEFRILTEKIDEPYQIRVTKITEDYKEKKWGDLTWESYQETIAEIMQFDNLAAVQLHARASDQFNSVPDFWGVYEGRTVKVPSNYDPVARTYTGVWDGTWKIEFTDNPAYIAKDLIENTRYGMARFYPVTVNSTDVYEAGVWCDTPVTNGSGGTRPRFTFNGLISEPRSGKETVEYVIGLFGGRFIDDGNGSARIRIDDDRPAVALFAHENIEDGAFTYSYTDVTTRYNDITVSFTNPTLNWQEDRRRVFDQDHIDTYGRIPYEFIAVGCTNASEAIARANYKLITGITERTMVTFRTNRGGLYLEPYDIILIADEDMENGIHGRVLQKVDTRNFTVRSTDPVYLEAGFEYKVYIQTIDTSGNVLTLSTHDVHIDSIGLSTTNVKVMSDLPADMPENAVFAIIPKWDPNPPVSSGVSNQYLGIKELTANGTTIVNDIVLGDDTEDRIVVLMICWAKNEGTGDLYEINSITVSGISFTRAVRSRDAADQSGVVEIWYASIPAGTGTTGDGTFEFNRTGNIHLDVHSHLLKGFQLAPTAIANAWSSVVPSTTVNVDVEENSIVFAGVNNSSGGRCDLIGDVPPNRVNNHNQSGTATFSYGEEVQSAAGTLTVGYDHDANFSGIAVAVWTPGVTPVENYLKPYRVMTLEEREDDPDNILVTAVEVNRNKWAIVDASGIDDGGTLSPNDPITPVKNLHIRSLNEGGSYTLIVSWSRHTNPLVTSYKVWHQLDGGVWSSATTVTNPYYTYPNAEPGLHVFRVVAVASDGRESTSVYVQHDLGTQLRGVASALNLRITSPTAAGEPTQFTTLSPEFTWDLATPIDPFLDYFELRILSSVLLTADSTTITADSSLLTTDTVQIELRKEILPYGQGSSYSWVYAYDLNVSDGGGEAARAFTVSVVVADLYGNLSLPITLDVEKAPLPVPTGVVVSVQGQTLTVQTDPVPTGATGIVVHASQVMGFIPAPANQIYKGTATNVSYQLPASGTWYVRVAYYDDFSASELAYTTEQSVNVAPTGTLTTYEFSVPLTVGTAVASYIMPTAMSPLTKVQGILGTASTSGDVVLDVLEDGVSILSTVVTIDEGTKNSAGSILPPVISDSALAENAEITVDVSAIGTGAANLRVRLVGYVS